MKNLYCEGCTHESTCKYSFKVNELLVNYGNFLSFICKYRDSKPVKEEPKKEVKPYKMKDIYEGMSVSKFGAE